MGPFDPNVIVDEVDVSLLPDEEIGLLTQPVEPARWLAVVRDRYRFVVHLDDVERQVARCNPGDRYRTTQLIAALTEPSA